MGSISSKNALFSDIQQTICFNLWYENQTLFTFYFFNSQMETNASRIGDGKEEEIRTGKDSQVVVKDVFLSGNEAQEDRVNIHHPSSYL